MPRFEYPDPAKLKLDVVEVMAVAHFWARLLLEQTKEDDLSMFAMVASRLVEVCMWVQDYSNARENPTEAPDAEA